MNQRQAVALAIGTILAVLLVLSPRMGTPLRPVSRQVEPDGTIVTVQKSTPIFWQPAAFAVVVLVTGVMLYRLRSRKQPGTEGL